MNEENCTAPTPLSAMDQAVELLRGASELDVDIVGTIVRIAQVHDLVGGQSMVEPLPAMLVERLASCDVRRLIQYLSPQAVEALDILQRGREIVLPFEVRPRERRSLAEIFRDARS